MEKSRLFNILMHLLQYKKSTARELADKFEVSIRTIYRDIDTLSSSGIPVYTIKGSTGGIYIYEDYALDRLMFSQKEKENLLLALKGLDSMIESDSELVSKMTSFFNSMKTDWICIENSTWSQSNEIKKCYSLIKEAIINRRQLMIDYYGSNKSWGRIIDPIKIIYKDKKWYLHAFCYKRNDYRNFKLTRIKNIKKLDSKTNVIEPYSQLFNEDCEDYPKIIIEFSTRVLHRVYDDFTEEQIQHDVQNKIRVELSIPIDEWLYSYLLSFAGDATIVYPNKEREKFKAYLQDFAKKIINS